MPESVAAVNRVPAELIIRIVEECKMESSLPTFELLDRPPWLFTEVCRYWRDTLIATPEFWTNIELHCMQPLSEKQESFQLRRCQLQLQRSKGLPLKIRTYTLFPHRALEAILRHKCRWQDVELRMSPPVFVCFLVAFNTSPSTAANLERLFISLFDPIWSLDSQPPILPAAEDFTAALDAFVNTPKLHHLSLVRMLPAGYPVFPWEFSWAHLQSLTLTDSIFDIIVISHMLVQCSVLVRLTLNARSAVTTPKEVDPQHLPTYGSIPLEKLQYFECYLTGSCNYFAMIKAPALEELIIRNNVPTLSLALFTKDSGSRIKRLTLEQFSMQDETDVLRLARSLWRLPVLEALSVHFMQDTDDDSEMEGFWGFMAMDCLLLALTFRESTPYCPRLSELKLEGASCTDASHFIDMLASRSAVSPRDSKIGKRPDQFLSNLHTAVWPQEVAEVFEKEELERIADLSRGMQFSLINWEGIDDGESDEASDDTDEEDDWETDSEFDGEA